MPTPTAKTPTSRAQFVAHLRRAARSLDRAQDLADAHDDLTANELWAANELHICIARLARLAERDTPDDNAAIGRLADRLATARVTPPAA